MPSHLDVSPLAGADRAALARSNTRKAGDTIVPCPGTGSDEKKAIGVRVVGEDGVGLNDIALLLMHADKRVIKGKTGPTGTYMFKGLDPGSYELHLPELDMDAWLTSDRQVLPDAGVACSAAANWQSAGLPLHAGERVHVIEDGECIGKIAAHYGFFSKTIWDFAANQDLRKLRHDDMYILFKDDRVVIPAKRHKAETVATGERITIRRQGVPERLRIRFLAHDASPRAGVRYVVSLVVDDGMPVPSMLGQTDAGGFVDQPMPPATVLATITLDPASPEEEIYEFKIGHVAPIDQVAGWQARLNNLGYDCGPRDGIFGERTRAAVLAFQRAEGIEDTGEMDDATRTALRALSLS